MFRFLFLLLRRLPVVVLVLGMGISTQGLDLLLDSQGSSCCCPLECLMACSLEAERSAAATGTSEAVFFLSAASCASGCSSLAPGLPDTSGGHRLAAVSASLAQFTGRPLVGPASSRADQRFDPASHPRGPPSSHFLS